MYLLYIYGSRYKYVTYTISTKQVESTSAIGKRSVKSISKNHRRRDIKVFKKKDNAHANAQTSRRKDVRVTRAQLWG
jgi:hypothetical protein